MNILITGVTSSIGSVLCPALIGKHNLIGWTRNKSKVNQVEIKVQEVDLFQLEFPIVDDSVDVIIHLAAETPGSDHNFSTEKLKRFQNINVKSTAQLVELAKEKQVKQIVYVSSHAVDDFRDGDGVIQNAYAKSKWEAEEIVKESGLPFTIFRSSGIYGDTPYWRKYLQEIKKTKTIVLYGDAGSKLQYISVNDFVDVIEKSIGNEKSFGKLYKVGGGDIITKYQYFKVLKAYTGSSMSLIRVPYFVISILLGLLSVVKSHYKMVLNNIRHARKDLTVDNDLVKKDLGYQPKKFSEGIKNIKWTE